MHVLRFVYGENAPKDDYEVNEERETIDVCYLYGVVDLKIAAESDF